jgi:hypothetical protein
MRRAWLIPLLLCAPLLGASSCPLQVDLGDGGAPEGDGGAGDAGPTGRHVGFGDLPPGELGPTTIDGVTLTPGAYQGNQTILVDDLFGEGQDVWLQCGLLTITPPELHQAFQLVFNDDSGTIIVSAYDQDGQLLTDRPVDTRADASATGITAVDQVYKRLVAQMAAGSPRRIARLEVGSCAGGLHEIVLQ